jgi:SAM-dependent methyltransferase
VTSSNDTASLPGLVVACRHAWRRYLNDRCLCTFVRCDDCGVIRKVSRCSTHTAASQDTRSSREYYQESFDDGIPLNARYAQELGAALREMDAPAFPRDASILEVGCGIGRLVPWFLHGGLRYTAVETDPWAGRYVREAYQVEVEAVPWQDVAVEPRSFDIVASLHFLEHTAEADVAFEKMVMVARRFVLLVVPDGSDVWNPDHWWMFSQDVLRTWARNLGLRLCGPVQKSVAVPEETIYALFELPDDRPPGER